MLPYSGKKDVTYIFLLISYDYKGRIRKDNTGK